MPRFVGLRVEEHIVQSDIDMDHLRIFSVQPAFEILKHVGGVSAIVLGGPDNRLSLEGFAGRSLVIHPNRITQQYD